MKNILQNTAIALLCIFITTATLAQKTKPIAYGSNPAKGKYVDIKGFRMYYEVYGTGKPLLFIHGNGGSISSFSKQIPYFSKEYKVIVADSRAQGKSLDAGEILNYEMMADDCNALLDHLHLDSCYVVGWSDGGINGLLLAMRHPKKVKKLAITGANLWPDTTALEPFVYHWIVNQADSLSKLKQTPDVKNQFKLMNMMLKEPNISLTQLKAVKCPTLVMAGDHDVIPTKHTVQIAEAISQSYLWIIPKSGHSTLIVHDKQFNQIVNDFFKKPFQKIEGLDRFN